MPLSLARHLHRIVAAVQSDAEAFGLSRPGDRPAPLVLFDQIIVDIGIRRVSRDLFADGYYANAVEECYKYLCNAVKERSGDRDKDGFDLMLQVFDEDRPVLALNDLRSVSERSEQRGYKFIYAGVMAGIRNPRAHQHQYLDDPAVALEMIAWGQHLMRKLSETRKRRRRGKRKPSAAPPQPRKP